MLLTSSMSKGGGGAATTHEISSEICLPTMFCGKICCMIPASDSRNLPLWHSGADRKFLFLLVPSSRRKQKWKGVKNVNFQIWLVLYLICRQPGIWCSEYDYSRDLELKKCSASSESLTNDMLVGASCCSSLPLLLFWSFL